MRESGPPGISGRHFWQGRFGCVAMDEQHLLAAQRYVALNLVRARRRTDRGCPRAGACARFFSAAAFGRGWADGGAVSESGKHRAATRRQRLSRPRRRLTRL